MNTHNALVDKDTHVIREIQNFEFPVDIVSVIPPFAGTRWMEGFADAAVGDAIFEGILYHRPEYALSFESTLPGWVIDTARQLEDAKTARIAAVDARTMNLILAGFDYEIGGTKYHFGYDATDQGNFTKAAVSATLALTQNQQNYRQAWRGWVNDMPHTLSLTAAEFIGLAIFAGKDHQEGLLASGWALTEQVRAAATIEEVETIGDER